MRVFLMGNWVELVFNAPAFIAARRSGARQPKNEIDEFVVGLTQGKVPDYQVSAWLMAACFKPLSPAETLELTLAMAASGTELDLTSITRPTVDKHSTGGVGDKTTLVVAPLLAACGAAVLKMSGRGLSYTGGTIDKLESIPGFSAAVTPAEAVRQVREIGVAVISQSPQLVPADSVLYALRDVTSTVNSIPLLASSIMSKKLAAGADAILLDVKVGPGAFMSTVREARALATLMVGIGTSAGRKVVACITRMDQPIGLTVGNALEVAEAICVLTGNGRTDSSFTQLCMTLAARGLMLAGICNNEEAAVALAARQLKSGAAARVFENMIRAQGGDPRVVLDQNLLPAAPTVKDVLASRSGFIKSINARGVGELVMRLGGGRRVKGAKIDHRVGIEFLHKVGDAVVSQSPIARIHSGDRNSAAVEAEALVKLVCISERPVRRRGLVVRAPDTREQEQ